MSFATAKEWRDTWGGEFGEWRDRASTRKALTEFDKLKGSEDDHAKTLGRIAAACLQAMQYKAERDPGEIYRKKLTRQRKSVANLSAAARTLANACKRGDIAMKWSLPGGGNSLGVRLDRPHDDQLVDVLAMGGEWFSELESNLKNKLPELNGGPFLDRFIAGNLHFEKAIAAGRKIDVPTMLAFELTFYLRLLTGERAGHALQSAERMPSFGKPSPSLVAMFCNSALGTNLEGRQVADRLRKLPIDVGLMTWPNAE